jgi:hypothetical protein
MGFVGIDAAVEDDVWRVRLRVEVMAWRSILVSCGDGYSM